MVSQLEAAKRTGAIDVSRSPGQRPQAGFATIVRPSRTASQADIRRAIQTGVFPFRFFSVQPTRVRTTGTFVRRVPTGVGGRPLAPASIRALQKQGILKPRFETRAGIVIKSKPETRAQFSSRLASERRVLRTFGDIIPTVSSAKLKAQELERARQFFRQKGGPLARDVTFDQLRSPIFQEFNLLFQPRTFTPNQIDVLSRKLNIEVAKLNKRIDQGTATQAQINKLSVLLNQFERQAGKTEGKRLRQIFKERPSPIKPEPITRIEIQDTIADIKFEDIVPKEFGGQRKSVEQIVKETGEEFRKEFAKEIPGFDLPVREKTILSIGRAVGLFSAVIDPIFGGVSFVTQEGLRAIGVKKRAFETTLPFGITKLVKQAKASKFPILTDPLQFLDFKGNTILVSRRALSQVPVTLLELRLLLVGGKKATLVQTRKGKVVKELGVINISRKKDILGNIRKIAVKDIPIFTRKLTSKIGNIREIKASTLRIGLEAQAFVGRNRTRFLVLKAKTKIKLKPIDEILTTTREVTNVQVKKAVNGIKSIRQDLKNIRAVVTSNRTKGAIGLEIKRLRDAIRLITPTIGKKGRFLDFTKFQRFRRSVADSFKRIGVEVRSLKPSVRVTAKRGIRELKIIKRDVALKIERRYEFQLKKINAVFKNLDFKTRQRFLKQFRTTKSSLNDKLSKLRTEINKKRARIDTEIVGTAEELNQFLRLQIQNFNKSIGKVIKQKITDKPSIKELNLIRKTIEANARSAIRSLKAIPKNVALKIKRPLNAFVNARITKINKLRTELVKKIRGDLLTKREKRRLIKQIRKDVVRLEFEAKKAKLEAIKKKIQLEKRIGRRLEKVERRKIDKFFGTKKFTQRRAGSRLKRRLTNKEKRLSKRIGKEEVKLKKIRKKEFDELRLEKRLERIARKKKGIKSFELRRKEARLTRRKLRKDKKNQLREIEARNKELRTARKLSKIESRKLGLKKFELRRKVARGKRRIARKKQRLENRQLKERVKGLSEFRLGRKLSKVERRKLGVKKFVERRKQARLRRRANATRARKELKELIATKRDNQALRLQRKIQNFERKQIGTPSQEDSLLKQLIKQVRTEKKLAKLAIKREKLKRLILLLGKAPRGQRSNAQLLKQALEREKLLGGQIKRFPIKKPTKLGKGEKLVKTKTGQVQIIKTDTKKILKSKTKQVRKQRARAKQVTKTRQQLKLKQKNNVRQIVLLKNRLNQQARGITSSKTQLKSNIKTRTQLKQQLRPITIPKTRPKEVTRFRTRQKVKFATKQALKTKQIQKLKQRQEQRLGLRQRERLRLTQRLKQKFKVPSKKPPKIPPIILLPKPQTVSFETIKRSKGGFNVIVRKFGKRVRINKFPLSASQALAFGGNRVDNSARASFILVRAKGRTRTIKVPKFNRSKFRPPRGNTRLQRFSIVERSRFRIDTKNEKREITRKGIRARRRGKVRGNPRRNNLKKNSLVRKRVTVKRKKPNNLVSFLFK